MLAHLQDPQESAAKAPEVTSLEGLLQDIRSRRKEFEAQKFISQDIIERFRKVGVYRALVAKRFGGDE